MFAFTQSNRFKYSTSKVLLYKNGKNATKTCNICFKTMRGDYLKMHMLKHEKERNSESNIDKIKIGKHLAKTCDICFKTMRGDHLKRHILKHENRKKG